MNQPNARTFPVHKCGLYLTHNQHRDYYLTAAQGVNDDPAGAQLDWVSYEEREKAIATDEVWTLQWYPETPIGFYCIAASDLDVLLRAAHGVREEGA